MRHEERFQSAVVKAMTEFEAQFVAACRMAHRPVTRQRLAFLAEAERFRLHQNMKPLTTRQRARLLASVCG